MGKQRVDTGLLLRRVEKKFRLAVFLQHGIVARDRDLSEGLPIRRNAVAKQTIVEGVGDRGRAQHQ